MRVQQISAPESEFNSPLDLFRAALERNRTMGGREGGLFDRDGFAAFERQYARKGPPPQPGLRVALWDGFDETPDARMRDQDVSISP